MLNTHSVLSAQLSTAKRVANMATVFDVFTQTSYDYLKISRGGVAGDGIVSETPASGVFKLRTGVNVANDQETKTSDATLHIKPSEPFVTNPQALVGNGIRWQGTTYAIEGVTEGRNFETGVVEHYRLTLGEQEFETL